VQPCFLAASAPAVSQYLAIADEEYVRDELLVTLVLFGLSPVQVHKLRTGCYDGQVFLDFEAKALKHSNLLE